MKKNLLKSKLIMCLSFPKSVAPNLNKIQTTLFSHFSGNSNDKFNDNFTFFHYTVESFTPNNFILDITRHLTTNTTYSFIIKINSNNNTIYKMCGRQIGIIIKDNHDLNKYEDIYYVILQRIDVTSNLYDYITDLSRIEIMFKSITHLKELKLKNINNLKFGTNLVNSKQTKNNFNNNYLPLTIEESYFGNLLSLDDRLNFEKLITKSNKIETITVDENDKLFHYENKTKKTKLLILSKQQTNSEFLRYVFDTKTGILIFLAKDIIIENNEVNYTFIRTINNVSITIKNETILKIEVNNKLEPIKPVNYNKLDRNNNIGTLDLETYTENSLSKVYSIGFLTTIDKEPTLFYINNQNLNKRFARSATESINLEKLTNLKTNLNLINNINSNNNINIHSPYLDNSDILILNCINSILIKKYNKFTFYTHNFGRFDCIFIIKTLTKVNTILGFDYYLLKTIFRDNVVIKLQIKIDSNYVNQSIIENLIHPQNLYENLTNTETTENITKPLKKTTSYIKITIVDSLNLLNKNLEELGIDFKTITRKGKFPHRFVNSKTINYLGDYPPIIYFDNLNIADYNLLKTNYDENSYWNLKQELLIYLNDDLNCHLEIMEKFSKILYTYHNTEMTQALTITRLSLNIFLSDYYKIPEIPLIIKKHIFDFIYSAYFGGITEVYIPYGQNLGYVDVNSLYPNSALNDMPGLECLYIETFDNKGLNLDELFGFFYAKIKTNDQYLGLLPVHENGKLIFPNGEFTGIWSSEELKFAKENGYEIVVIKGYNFNKVKHMFKEFITHYYSLKKNNIGIFKQIAKSLLNNLLGRFGLNITKPITDYVSFEERDIIASTKEIYSQTILNNNTFLVSYSPITSKIICEEHGIDYLKALERDLQTNLGRKIELYKNVSIATSAMITAYARIQMNKIKLLILQNGGKIYYSDTDSIVIDMDSIKFLTIDNNIGNFKLEYENIKEAYFISNKTYCLLLKNDKLIIKTKGVDNNKLSLNDFKEMYLNNKNIQTNKSHTITNHEKGSVVITNKLVTLNFDSFTKRKKIYNNKNMWIDTIPLKYYN